MKLIQAMAVAGAVMLAVMPVQAQQDYPNAPIHIVCGFAPGSTADLSARVVGAKMGQILGQQIIVESRLGAASSIAGAAVARAPKDGYTLYVGSAANLINAAMSSSSNLNFDFVKDFTPVTLLTSTPTVLVMHPDAGVKNVKELIALAKAKPDTLSFGSSGVASSTHLALELFKSLAQVKIIHVPYSGSPPVVTDLLAGRLQGFFAPASSVMEHANFMEEGFVGESSLLSTIPPDLCFRLESRGKSGSISLSRSGMLTLVLSTYSMSRSCALCVYACVHMFVYECMNVCVSML